MAAFALVAGCRGGGPDRLAPPVVDLGPGYEEVPAGGGVGARCSLAIAEPARRAARSFVSSAAQERIDLRVLRYRDEPTASAAFAGARSGSSCRPSEHDAAGGRPAPVEVRGAATSFSIGFADELDSGGFTVCLVGDTVVVVEATLHQGAPRPPAAPAHTGSAAPAAPAGTAGPLGGHEVAARAIERLR